MRLGMSVLVIALLTVGSALTTSAAVKDDGLILYFSFDEAKGGTIKDETGGGNDGDIVKGAKIATDEVVHGKGSILFEAGTDSVTVDSFKELEDYQDNSYLFWVNFTKANSGGWDQIIAKKHPAPTVPPVYGPVTVCRCTSTIGFNRVTRAQAAQGLRAKTIRLKSANGIISQVLKTVPS